MNETNYKNGSKLMGQAGRFTKKANRPSNSEWALNTTAGYATSAGLLLIGIGSVIGFVRNFHH